MSESIKNGVATEQVFPTEHQIAQIMGENSVWINENENRLLAEHPEYWGKYAMIASRCPDPLLAVDQDHDVAYEKALKSEDLQRVAAAEELPPDCLVTRLFLGDDL